MNLAAIVNAYDVRGPVPQMFGADAARAIGAAFADVVVLPDGATEVVVGRDMRASSQEISEAVVDGLVRRGVDVVDLGLCSTDEVYYASGTRGAPAAMVTGSHGPADHNGVKLRRAGARPVDAVSGLTDVASAAEAYLDHGLVDVGTPGQVRRLDVLADYADHLRALVDLSAIRPLVVVVDAGHGMAGLTVPAVVSAAQQEVPVTLVQVRMDLDPRMPGRAGGALEADNLTELRQCVRDNGADIGIAFDADADRCLVVDENGDTVSPSTITAVVGLRMVELEQRAGRDATVVHNLITSRAVPDLMHAAGAQTVAARVGHPSLIRAMADNDAVFGGEHSGHYYFRDFFHADDGLLAALHLVAALGEQDYPLSVLAELYEPYSASGEINLTVDDLVAVRERVVSTYGDEPDVEIDLTDGVTVSHWGSVPQWWFNLREAATEPVMRLNVEAADEDMMEKVRDDVTQVVRGVQG